MLLLMNTTKIELVSLYAIKSSYEVTNLSLQKLLYYIKAFGFIMLQKDVLNESCEAWVHGPVFPNTLASLGHAVAGYID